MPSKEFSLSWYFSSLFLARPGFYRVIVFVVSSEPFNQTPERIKSAVAEAWLREGYNVLPDELSHLEFSSSHVCTALIYEFERPDEGNPVRIAIPGRHAGVTHLDRSGFLGALR